MQCARGKRYRSVYNDWSEKLKENPLQFGNMEHVIVEETQE
jgi:hypothetical protein